MLGNAQPGSYRFFLSGYVGLGAQIKLRAKTDVIWGGCFGRRGGSSDEMRVTRMKPIFCLLWTFKLSQHHMRTGVPATALSETSKFWHIFSFPKRFES